MREYTHEKLKKEMFKSTKKKDLDKEQRKFLDILNEIIGELNGRKM